MNRSKKKICLVTGSRADYYLQKNLISNLKKSKKYNLSLIVTGQHLSEVYGKTKNEVYQDFGSICHSIDINLKKTKEFLKTEGYIVLDNNQKIPVSRQKKAEFLDKF